MTTSTSTTSDPSSPVSQEITFDRSTFNFYHTPEWGTKILLPGDIVRKTFSKFSITLGIDKAEADDDNQNEEGLSDESSFLLDLKDAVDRSGADWCEVFGTILGSDTAQLQDGSANETTANLSLVSAVSTRISKMQERRNRQRANMREVMERRRI